MTGRQVGEGQCDCPASCARRWPSEGRESARNTVPADVTGNECSGESSRRVLRTVSDPEAKREMGPYLHSSDYNCILEKVDKSSVLKNT